MNPCLTVLTPPSVTSSSLRGQELLSPLDTERGRIDGNAAQAIDHLADSHGWCRRNR